MSIKIKLYNDYSRFKNSLFENLVKNNKECDELTLFKKSQKLIDRFLFILFSEDRGLLPANLISKIIGRFERLKEDDNYKPLYDIYKQYFEYINKGRENEKEPIPEYNGGLFRPDEILDNLIIDDDILKEDLLILSGYDFNTEVDVNILGHIFEHSLSEIDEITAKIEGTATDKTKSKRKKDGVFYTPAYITKYIVENTIGTLCKEKRKELGLDEVEIDESHWGKKGTLSAKGKNLLKIFEDYRDWLLTLKIVDPACGSGAFLNQALNFLIAEHEFIIDLKQDLQKGQTELFEIETAVLENNLYGVDINEESVEIAKLSLWLRTAKKGRKLSVLSSNIKCGNSLIDDPDVAGDKAFNWKSEFLEVFKQGGFDVVIGNPPYVNFSNLPKVQREFFKKYSKICKNKTDLYAFFTEKSTQILKLNGLFSFIFPHTWVSTISFTPLSELLFKNYTINNLVELEHGVFQDAIVKTVIIVCKKDMSFTGVPIYDNSFQFVVCIPKEIIFNDDERVLNFDWTPQKGEIQKKLFSNSVRLDKLLKFTRGIKTSNDKKFLGFQKKDGDYKKIIRGRNIKAYRIDYENEYIWYRPELIKEKVGSLPHSKELFEVKEKLITQRINSSGELLVAYDDKQFYCLDTTNVSVVKNSLEVDLKYIMVIINSKVINWWFNDKFKMPTISGYELHQIPVKINKSIEEKVISFGNLKIVQANKKKQVTDLFLNYIHAKFPIEKFSKKLQSWHELEPGDFLKELNKAIKKMKDEKLSKADEMDWLELFETKKAKAQILQSEINKTDNEIDQMVYKLYGLTKEEIGIVEGENEQKKDYK